MAELIAAFSPGLPCQGEFWESLAGDLLAVCSAQLLSSAQRGVERLPTSKVESSICEFHLLSDGGLEKQ